MKELVDKKGLVRPMRRNGEVEEVARCILFLASPAASFVTGVNLPVDGGYMLATKSPEDA